MSRAKPECPCRRCVNAKRSRRDPIFAYANAMPYLLSFESEEERIVRKGREFVADKPSDTRAAYSHEWLEDELDDIFNLVHRRWEAGFPEPCHSIFSFRNAVAA